MSNGVRLIRGVSRGYGFGTKQRTV